MNLNLDEKEQEILADVMTHALATLDIEIHRADNIEFKQRLKLRRDIMESILTKLEQASPVLSQTG